MKRYNVEELNHLYDTAERVDEELFSEMRSNLLLVAGRHYSKRTSKFFARLRNTNRLSEMQKLRITKNHVHKISRYYRNAVLAKVPGVVVSPQNDQEMQDRKVAEMNQAAWVDAKNKYKLRDRIREWASNFIDIGEVCVKVFWDPNEGELVGYEPGMLPDGSDYERDEMGEVVPDKGKPIFSGGFVFETVHGFNLLRSPHAKSMDASPYLIVRKMVDKNELKKRYAEDKEKSKYIEDSEKETYVVFESSKAQYDVNDHDLLIKEYYFKPCLQYPEGYFYIATEFGILEEGPVPFGIYPLVWKGFDEFASTPRAHSIIKVARPYQAEINRAASQMATHQITVGDDKIIYQSGTKLAPGALLPGVRGLTYQGMAPQILPGREGGQFLPYIQSQISEMYQACMLDEINMEESHNLDPYSLLFRSASQQQKFSQYTEKFESFLVELCELYLRMAKVYLPDGYIIQAVGKSEIVNLQEFKSTIPLNYQIKVEPQSDSVDTKLGRQIALNHVLQYVGKQLKPDDIGRIIKNMPFLNNDELFSDLTADQEMVENDMLSIERGEVPEVSPYANNQYYIKRLTHRMKLADYKALDPQIQQIYQMFLKAHEDEEARKVQALMDAKNEFIPVGGAMITCSMHIPDPENPGQTKQVRVPYQALDWLVKKLESQGMGLDKLEDMNQGALAEIAQQMMSERQAQMGPPLPMGPPGMVMQ